MVRCRDRRQTSKGRLVSGLYQKALKYLQTQRQLRLVKPDEIGEEEALDVSPDDREKILSHVGLNDH